MSVIESFSYTFFNSKSLFVSPLQLKIYFQNIFQKKNYNKLSNIVNKQYYKKITKN